MSDPRTNWKKALQRTADCIAIDRLGEELTPQERAHLDSCATCQAEMALWKEFEAAETRADEQEDVDWITGQLQDPAPANVVQISSWRKALNPRALAVAATLVIAVAIGYIAQNREPAIDLNATTGQETYRSARVNIITPQGDVDVAPTELRWEIVSGATRYDVQVVEVDRTVLWRVSTRDPRVELPPAVTAQFVPGKSVLFQVTALRDRTVLADSGMQRFRVKAR